MRKIVYAAAALTVALAACGKSGEQGRGNQAAKAPGGSGAPIALKLNPGLWETSVDIATSGLPANVAAMMKGTKVTTRSCITEEQAGRPSGEIFANKQEKGCTYSDYSVSGGSIHGRMSCNGVNGHGAMTMAMDGHYGGDSFDVTMKTDTREPGQNVAVGSHVMGRRIGACPAGGTGDAK